MEWILAFKNSLLSTCSNGQVNTMAFLCQLRLVDSFFLVRQRIGISGFLINRKQSFSVNWLFLKHKIIKSGSRDLAILIKSETLVAETMLYEKVFNSFILSMIADKANLSSHPTTIDFSSVIYIVLFLRHSFFLFLLTIVSY